MAYSVSPSTSQQARAHALSRAQARGQQSPLGFRPTGKSTSAAEDKENAGKGGGKNKEKVAPLGERGANVVQDDMDEDDDEADDELSMLRRKAPSPPKRKPAARRTQQRRAQVMAIERLQGKRSDLRPRSMWAPKVPCTKRSHFDLELSDDEDESPPPAKKAATGAARKRAHEKKATPALEDDEDDDDIYSLPVKKPAAHSPKAKTKATAKKQVVALADSDDELLPAPKKKAAPAKAKPAAKEAVLESDDESVVGSEPAIEEEAVNEEFVVYYDSFEEAQPLPEKEAAAAVDLAEEVPREKEVVGLGDMGGEVIAALEKRPVAGKDKRAGLLTFDPAAFFALDRMGLKRKQKDNFALSSSAAPAAAVEKRRPSIRRSRVARTSFGSSASGQTRIEHAPRTTTYGVQWGVGSSTKAAAPGPSGAPAAAAAATGSVRPYSQAFAKLRAVFEPEGASGSSTSARKAPSSKAWKR